jgi:4-methylaminobutanoate oxidase (formaldehyde-forming)
VSGAACATRDLHWLHRHVQARRVRITDITNQYAVFGIMGPKARAHLQPLTDHSLAHADFPFATSAALQIGGIAVRATRITYVGELGWELYVPWQQAPAVYRALTRQRIQHAGYHAMDSLRMEKAYRHWGHDISDEDTPVEAGLTFTADFDKPGGFIGDEAIANQRATGVGRRLALFKLQDSDTLLTHDEPIWLDDETVGHIVSSAYSYTFDCSLGFGYVQGHPSISREQILAGEYRIEVADKMVPASVSLRALYDPDNKRVHC